MVTHYNGSKGPVEIATMPFTRATNAVEKLRRERTDDSRDAEISALDSHLARLAEEYAESQVSE